MSDPIRTHILVSLITAATKDEDTFAGARALGISGFFPTGGSLEGLTDLLEVALRMLRQPRHPQPDGSASDSGRTPLGRPGMWWRHVRARLGFSKP